MCIRTKKLILIFTLVFAVPTTVLATDWLIRWQSSHTIAPQQTARELLKLYQLREFCSQSDLMEKRSDFVIQKVRDTKTYRNNEAAQWESNAVTTNVGPSVNATLNDLIQRRNHEVQNLRDRNSRYLEKIYDEIEQYGRDDPSIRGHLQAKHAELAQSIQSGDFQGCMAELDSILPTKLKKGGRQ